MTGLHPCVLVQNDIGNQNSALTIVTAVTSNLRAASLPVGVFVKAGEGELPHDCVVHCGHIYTVDKKRLRTRLGQLPSARMIEVDQAMLCSIGL